MKNLKIAAAVALFAGVSYSAAAVEATGQLDVTASVSASCSVGVSTMDFGTITSAALSGGDQTGTGTVNVICANTQPYTIFLDLDTSETNTARIMALTSDATETLTYALYSDSGYATPIDGTTGIDETGTGSNLATTIYGKIFATSTAVPGDYTDTVNIRVVY